MALQRYQLDFTNQSCITMKFFVSVAGVDDDDADDCLLLGARLLRPRRRLRPLPPLRGPRLRPQVCPLRQRCQHPRPLRRWLLWQGCYLHICVHGNMSALFVPA